MRKTLILLLLLFQTLSAFAKSEPAKLETIVVAAGCFWGTEEYFRKIPGVVEVKVGYTGGSLVNPTYEQVTTGKTGHAEAAEIKFDPKVVKLEDLLIKFFKFHDPTTLNKQGNDVGPQYRSGIYFANDAQKKTIQEIKDRVEKSKAWKAPIVTEIKKAEKFYPAEEEHQKYLIKNPGGYDNHFERNLNF